MLNKNGEGGVVPMRNKLPIPMVTAIFTAIFVCVMVCCAAQAAAKYIVAQENKNNLIASVGEDVDVLRSCLQPISSFSQAGAKPPIDMTGIADMIPKAGVISISDTQKCTAIAPSPREEIAGKEKSGYKSKSSLVVED